MRVQKRNNREDFLPLNFSSLLAYFLLKLNIFKKLAKLEIFLNNRLIINLAQIMNPKIVPFVIIVTKTNTCVIYVSNIIELHHIESNI